jgi:predicted nucleic acid-binding protein
VFISAITEAELRYGVALLPPGKRRSTLAAVIDEMLGDDFTDRILLFDSAAAVAFAEIAATRRQAGPLYCAAWRANRRHRTVAGDPAPDVTSFISRVRSPYAPTWGGLQRLLG